jgi:hypothetical protein
MEHATAHNGTHLPSLPLTSSRHPSFPSIPSPPLLSRQDTADIQRAVGRTSRIRVLGGAYDNFLILLFPSFPSNFPAFFPYWTIGAKIVFSRKLFFRFFFFDGDDLDVTPSFYPFLTEPSASCRDATTPIQDSGTFGSCTVVYGCTWEPLLILVLPYHLHS